LNCAIKDIQFEQLIEKLGNFKSVIEPAVYDAALTECRRYYKRVFTAKSESTMKSNFHSLMTAISKELKSARPVTVSITDEVLSAAAGHVAKRHTDSLDKVHPNAGVAGKCDSVLRFGHPDYKDAASTALEFKFLNCAMPPAAIRWIMQTGALLPQTIQSHIGHDSTLSIAMWEHGFKVFFKEEVDEDELTEEERAVGVSNGGKCIRMYCWPTENKYHKPSFRSVDEGLKILGHVARLATAFDDDDEESESDVLLATPAKVPRTDNDCVDPGTERVLPAERRYATRSTTANFRKHGRKCCSDQVFFLRADDGSIIELERIDLNSRYTKEELAEILRNEYLATQDQAMGA
jgi:hypothetical protein